MVEIIRKATCDRCGKECYHIEETTFNETVTASYKELGKRINYYCFHYSTISCKTYDSRFGESEEAKVDLCGSCVSELEEWLKEKKGDKSEEN